MTEQHGPPRADVVDIAAAIDIIQVGAISPGDEAWCTPDTIEGADGRVDTSGNCVAGLFEQTSGMHGRFWHRKPL